MKVFIKIIKKHAREGNFWIESRIDQTIRDTDIMWDIVRQNCINAKYDSNWGYKH